MKRFIMLALVSLSVVAVAAAPSVAGNAASAKKTTGDITFSNIGYGIGDVPAHWVFNAHEATDKSPVKGSVFYEDMFGSYTAKVTAVSVAANGIDATFSAMVTVDNYAYASVGDTFTWTVHDLGEGGPKKDYFTYLPVGGAPVDLPVITAGNIQVHKN